MNYSLLSNFPEHLSLSYDSYQFLIGLVLAITSTIRWVQTEKMSTHSMGFLVIGALVGLEAFKTGALLSAEMLIAFGGIIGYQCYMILRRLYKDWLVRVGKEYKKPAWVEWCWPQLFPTTAFILGMSAFVIIHDTLF